MSESQVTSLCCSLKSLSSDNNNALSDQSSEGSHYDAQTHAEVVKQLTKRKSIRNEVDKNAPAVENFVTHYEKVKNILEKPVL